MTTFVTRTGWGALPPKTTPITIPTVSSVFIHHSASPPTDDPKKDVKAIQAFHMNSRGYSDIAYTLLVHPNETVLAGRLLGNKAVVGAHTSGHNTTSIAICAIGNYETDQAPDSLIRGINLALKWAADNGLCKNTSTIRPHSDVFSTACCGKNLKARLKELSFKGETVSKDALTRDEVRYIHILAYGGEPGPGYDFRHVGGPLHNYITEVFGPDPLLNENTLAAQVRNGVLTKGDCQQALDAKYEAIKKLFGK